MALPKRDRLDYQPYFRALADRLALKDWMVLVKDDAPRDSDAFAVTTPWYGRRRATVHLSEDFLKADETEQRQTAIHELIHCHLDTLERMVVDTPDMKRAARLALELAVDALADAFAPLMPLPAEILDAGASPLPTA